MVNSRGVTEVKPEKLFGIDLFWQAIGYTPPDVAEHTESKSANYEYDTAVSAQNKALISQHANARQRGQSEKVVASLKAIQKYNAQHGDAPISPKDYLTAIKQRARAARYQQPCHKTLVSLIFSSPYRCQF